MKENHTGISTASVIAHCATAKNTGRKGGGGFVAKSELRLSPCMQQVMYVVLADEPAWGKSICDQTGYGTHSVYPALRKLLKAGWITAHWEEPTAEDRPPRRFYEPAYDWAWYEPRLATAEKYLYRRWWQRS